MKREDGRKLFRAFLGNSRETAGEQRAMMEQMAVPSRERSLYSMVEHLLSLDETAWNRSWHMAFGRQSAGEMRRS